MVKVITYGTYDLLHYGHIRLLERAKALGDYLIVGVTADDFDKTRGKINVQQSLMERVEAVRATGIADEIIIEEYEGQKIDDIRRLSVDIFTVGSDWVGYFDYLNEFCKVIYLDRTEGISSTELRAKKREIRLGLIGDSYFINKVYKETAFVNGIKVNALYSKRLGIMDASLREVAVESFEELLECSDAIYLRSQPGEHYEQIKKALQCGKHVLYESPLTMDVQDNKELFNLAHDKQLILMEAVKTAYATAFSRLLLLVKGGKIGNIVSVDATCTSLSVDNTDWSGLFEWGPTALLPVLLLLGSEYKNISIKAYMNDIGEKCFYKVDFDYGNAFASVRIGDGVKSEGELIISGTKGYVYVPAPWWKTDYFEIRYEDSNDNKRYFYQLDGEGIRYELVAFLSSISKGKKMDHINETISCAISSILQECEECSN